MSFNSDKLKVCQSILQIESKPLLDKIKQLIIEESPDLWDELHDDVKRDVLLSIEELDRGEGIPHDKVMEGIVRWRKRLSGRKGQ
jgi:hypothetical protein